MSEQRGGSMLKLERMRTAFDRAFRNEQNENLEKIEKAADDLQSKIEQTDTKLQSQINGLIDGNFDDVALNTHIEEKLNDLETQYTPKLTEVSEQLEEREKFDKSKETLLYTAFNGLNGNELALYFSQDGVNLLPLHTNSIFRSGKVTRDISIMFHNNFYYLVFGTKDNANRDVIGIARTIDFKKYETWNISLPNEYINIWAPHWFKDGNNIYILISTSDGTQEVDRNGASIPFFISRYIKATDDNLTTFGQPVEMNYSKQTNRIDQAVYKVNGTYHLFVKNEFEKTMEHFRYNGSSIENANWQYFKSIDYKTPVEGPSLIYFKNKYWLYADGYTTRTSLACTSTDLINWSEPFQIKNDGNLRTQHFDVISLSEQQNEVLLRFMAKNEIEDRASLIGLVNPANKTILNLVDYVSNKVFTPAKNVLGEIVYQVIASEAVTINSINIDTTFENPKNIKQWMELKFGVFGNGSITFENNPSSGVITPNGQNYSIGKNLGSNDTVITLERIYVTDRFYRIRNALNLEQYLPNSAYLTTHLTKFVRNDNYQMVDLSTLATNGSVNNLVLTDNTVYFTTSSIVVNSVDVSSLNRIRDRIYFSLFSNGDSVTLTIKNGSSITLPKGADFVISKNNGNNENLIPFTRVYSTLKLIGY